MTLKVVPGQPNPLGATPDPRGTNFAVASGGDAVTLCLFDADGAETQLVLPDRDGDVWHGFVAGVGPGQAYGYRVSGPFDSRARVALQPREAAARPVRTRDPRFPRVSPPANSREMRKRLRQLTPSFSVCLVKPLPELRWHWVTSGQSVFLPLGRQRQPGPAT